jgi:TonB family protein
MNATLAQPPTAGAVNPEPDRWPRHRWWLVVAFIFAAQVGFIFLLGERKPAAPREPNPTPPIALAPEIDRALLELTDPTLFVLPNRHGFSGLAWALTPRSEFQFPDWNEPFRWLALPAAKLGEDFNRLIAANVTAPVRVAEKIEPRIAPLETAPAPTLAAGTSLQLEGGLAARTLRTALDLPAQSWGEVLNATALWVIIDASGKVVSATLQSSSLSADADQKAIELARDAQFEPIPPASGLTFGRMIFQWQTLAPPVENPAATP